MALLKRSQRRSDSARNNGAKSSGPKTPEGLDRARTVSVTHGLYATEETLKSTVDPDAFDALRQKYRRCWQPEDEYADDRVDDLVQARWDLNRLQLVRRNELTALFQQTGSVVDAETIASEPNGLVARLESRIRHLQRLISRLERDIYGLEKKPKQLEIEGPSQNSLKTNTAGNSRTPVTTVNSVSEPVAAPEISVALPRGTHSPALETAPSS